MRNFCRFSVLIPFLFMASCATPITSTTKYTPVPSGATLTLPPAPKRVAIEMPGTSKDEGATYLKYPTELKAGQAWKAPIDGAWVWDSKDLRGIIYGLTEPYKWIDKAQSIVDNHNRIVDGQKAEKEKKKKGWFGW